MGKPKQRDGSQRSKTPPQPPPEASTAAPSPGTAYWLKERLPWYPDGCFGPYRSTTEGYSRRELAADFTVHAIGVALGLVGSAMLLSRTREAMLASKSPPLPPVVAGGIVVYCISLMAMLVFSALFNVMVKPWVRAIWELQLADHTGILLLIAGTYTPFAARLCYMRLLAFVWTVGLVSFVAKLSKSGLDVIALHVTCFLLMGWAVAPVLPTVMHAFSKASAALVLVGGCTYTLGLLPWAMNRLEFHNAIWHLFVLAASAMFFDVIFNEIALPGTWEKWAENACHT
jgi:hemolysin III